MWGFPFLINCKTKKKKILWVQMCLSFDRHVQQNWLNFFFCSSLVSCVVFGFTYSSFSLKGVMRNVFAFSSSRITCLLITTSSITAFLSFTFQKMYTLYFNGTFKWIYHRPYHDFTIYNIPIFTIERWNCIWYKKK